jgi:phage gp36-like protein
MSNAQYVQMSDVNGRIPAPFLLEALDDNQDGVVDVEVWQAIQADVQAAIDGKLGQRYPVPFLAPLPAIVSDAARLFACELLYKRRGSADKVNPWFEEADKMRAKLDLIGAGKQPLTPELQRQKPSVSVVGERSKTTSASGKLGN